MEKMQNETVLGENQISDYHDEIRDIEMEGYELTVKKARNALFWAGGLIFLGEMISMYRTEPEFNPLILAVAIVEAGIFVALALWTKKKPYTAIVTGLCAFIGLLLLAAVVNGINDGAPGALKSIFGGIIIKAAILVSLIRPLKDAKDLQHLKEVNSI